MLAQASLFAGNSIQDLLPAVEQKRRSESSHFIHLRLDGRIGRDEPISMTMACHAESFHAEMRETHVSAGRRATCPAQPHLYLLDASIQSLTRAVFAAVSALRVVRLM